MISIKWSMEKIKIRKDIIMISKWLFIRINGKNSILKAIRNFKILTISSIIRISRISRIIRISRIYQVNSFYSRKRIFHNLVSSIMMANSTSLLLNKSNCLMSFYLKIIKTTKSKVWTSKSLMSMDLIYQTKLSMTNFYQLENKV